MRIFMAGILKLSRRLATWLTFGILLAILGLIFVAVGATPADSGGGGGEQGVDPAALLAFPAAYDNVIGFILGLGSLLAVVYGAAIAGSEWTWGTLKSAVARGESRSLYILATFAAIAAVFAIAIVLAVGFGVLAAIVGGAFAGVPTDGIGDASALGALPDKLARVWVAIVGEGALGFAIATLTRSQLAGIGVGVGVYFGGTFAAIFLPDIVKYLPFSAANAVLATPEGAPGGGGNQLPTLEPNIALLVVAAWLVGALIVAALFTERAEIAG
jgi:ABC-2 type transport system permease protein